MNALFDYYRKNKENLINSLTESNSINKASEELNIFMDDLQNESTLEVDLSNEQKSHATFLIGLLKEAITSFEDSTAKIVYENDRFQQKQSQQKYSLKPLLWFVGNIIFLVLILIILLLSNSGIKIAVLGIVLTIFIQGIMGWELWKVRFLNSTNLKQTVKSRPKGYTILSVQSESLTSRLGNAILTADKALDHIAYLVTNLNSEESKGWESDKDLLKIFQRLLASIYNPQSNITQHQIEDLSEELLRRKIDVINFEKGKKYFFELLPNTSGKSTKPLTVLPALIKDDKLLLRGRVLVSDTNKI